LSVAGALVLVEPHADQRGGHHTQSLPLLAAAAASGGRPVVLVAPRGIDSELSAAMERLGAGIFRRPRRWVSREGALLLSGRALDGAHRVLQPRFPERRLPYQLQLFGHCLIEAASLRIGRAALGSEHPITAVVLTANVTLHASACALAGVPHVRYLHDISRHESRAIRAVEWLTRRALRLARFFCPTAAVLDALRREYPGARSVVQPYALDDPAARVTEADRLRARERVGLLRSDEPVGSLIGGWWRVKDFSTVAEALGRVSRSFTLLVAGYRIDNRSLEQIASAHRGELVVIDRQLTSAELSDVYAASDFTIVSRMPGGKESGVTLDGVQRGVPVVVSDHDDELTCKLEGQPWARVFRRGDPDSLARALDAVCAEPLPPPPSDAAAALGMLGAEQMLAAFDRALSQSAEAASPLLG
jgi:hypothetical protein